MQSSETSTLLKLGKLIHYTQLYVLFWSYFLVTDVTHAKKKVDLKKLDVYEDYHQLFGCILWNCNPLNIAFDQRIPNNSRDTNLSMAA